MSNRPRMCGDPPTNQQSPLTNNQTQPMPSTNKIIIRGAREHNLKNIDVEIPRDKLVVITGLSGSGKSSLAFDTIYAEGQRRYVESLSSYARQFLGLMEKPDVDYIEGLSPAVSIEQRTAGRNPRSTVATVTEIYDYLRLLFARVGVPHCYKCGREIARQTVSQIVDRVSELPERTRVQILAPLVRGRKGEYREVFEQARKDGYVRVRVDGEVRSLDEDIALDKNRKHTIAVVVDRLVVEPKVRGRLADSLETALGLGDGMVWVDVVGGEELIFSERFACVACGISYEEIEPRLFSFNSPYGACPECDGLGIKRELDPDRVVPDKALSVNQGAIAPWGKTRDGWLYQQLRSVARVADIDLNKPFGELPKESQEVLLYGTGKQKIKFEYKHRSGRGEYIGKFEGVIPNLKRRYRQTQSGGIRGWIEGFMRLHPCPRCEGKRLKPEALSVKVEDRNIAEVAAFSVKSARNFFEGLRLSKRDEQIAHQILKEIRERLSFLGNVGLD